MIANDISAAAVLFITAVMLLYVAATDLKQYTIRNDFILILVGLFFLHTAIAGRWSALPGNLVIAGVVFLMLLYFYGRRWLGGGDVKILTVAFLWAGAGCALPFALLLCLSASLHALAARLGWISSERIGDDKRARIPFAPSVAAALIGIFILGCVRHPT
jgi:prepilin peptidase CpaA